MNIENDKSRNYFYTQLTNRNVWITERNGGSITELELFIYDELTHVDDFLVEPIYIPGLEAMKVNAAGLLNQKSIRYVIVADIYGDGAEYISPNSRLLIDLFETKKRNFYYPGVEHTFALEV